MHGENSWLKLVACAGALTLLTGGIVHVADAETVIVDLAALKGPAIHRASGFLLSISPEQPDDRLVRPLKPKLFRLRANAALNPPLYQRVRSYGAVVQVIISDSSGYPGPSGNRPGDGGDWTRWE